MRAAFSAMAVVSAIFVLLGEATTTASIRFDGLTWYHSEDPKRLVINLEGHLEWVNPKAPDQVTVRLPEMDLSDVGDVAEVRYLYKTVGVATGEPSTDPTLLSGTGDLRIGLFDSNGRGHIDRDDTGYRNDIWCGYLGYCARICPHLPVGIKRKHSDAIPGKFMKRTGAWEEDVCPSLLQKAGPYGKSQDLSGFGLELGAFSPLILKVERTGPNTLVFSVTLNNVTYEYVDDDRKLQPKRIDAMAIYFPNPKAYKSIILAGNWFSKVPDDDKVPACEVASSAGMKHVTVYGGPDIACGWPANHGVWSWDDGEILVGFSYGKFIKRNGHNIDEDGATYGVLARTTDGGETWEMENPGDFAGDGQVAAQPPGRINFAHPDFAMSVKCNILRGTSGEGESFWYSYDRGRNWHGAYHFGALMSSPELAGMEFTSRTDYIVNGPADCLVFMSARPVKTEGSIRKDKVFAARTTDGGKILDFVSWVVDLNDPYRAVMPSTVRCSPSKLVTTVRRRAVPENTNWVDAYVSNDNGRTWAFASRVGGTGGWNGNPPALVRLRDGRLCCVYGNRSTRKMLARLSKDEGTTWGREIGLRDDYQTDSFGDPDLGYPRLVQRLDGKLVAIYYWATKKHPQLHIAATIWDPGRGI